MEPTSLAQSLSLRDPDGVLLRTEQGRFLRLVHSRQSALIKQIFNDTEFLKKSSLVQSEIIADKKAKLLWQKYKEKVNWESNELGLMIEHQPVFFVSYPYEWPREALIKSGQLTLELADSAIEKGWGLKDATPYNVLFEGTKPVFVDWLSLERRSPEDPTWIAFAQFVRCFLIPLWLDKYSSYPTQSSLLTHRDGVSPELAYSLVRSWRRFSPTFFTWITLPVWLSKNQSTRKSQTRLYQPRQTNPDRAKFILNRLIGFLKTQLQHVDSKKSRWTQWQGYLSDRSPYLSSSWSEKNETLKSWLAKMNPSSVLDVGCNEGWFSKLAAEQGARVVAIDSDAEMVRRTWKKADTEELDIQALQIDICRPTPAAGWKNQEADSFLNRAKNKFDLVAALAVIHHLTVGERIQYTEMLNLLSEISKEHLIIEFVGDRDPSFAWAAKGRDTGAWQRNAFMKAIQERFQIVEQKDLSNSDRTLFWLKKKKRT